MSIRIENPCNCRQAEDSACRSIGCSAAQAARLRILNQEIEQDHMTAWEAGLISNKARLNVLLSVGRKWTGT